MTESKYAVVTTACADENEAEKIAALLLERRLAACVQMLPIDSRYVWKGEAHADREILLIIKCRRANYADIERAILDKHGYELPEILTVPVEGGYDKYLDWIGECERPAYELPQVTKHIAPQRQERRETTYAQDELTEALRVLESIAGKCEKALPKLREGSPQQTLTVRRIKALKIAAELIRRETGAV